jgi:chromate transporter
MGRTLCSDRPRAGFAILAAAVLIASPSAGLQLAVIAAGALVALIAIFLPGMLLVYGILPFWDRLRTKPPVRGALNGVNAAVVGILGAALYEPVWTSTILRPMDATLALLAFAALAVARLPVFVVVAIAAVVGTALTLI